MWLSFSSICFWKNFKTSGQWLNFILFQEKESFLYSAEEQHAGEMNSQRSKEWEKKWGQQVGCLTFSIDLSFC